MLRTWSALGRAPSAIGVQTNSEDMAFFFGNRRNDDNFVRLAAKKWSPLSRRAPPIFAIASAPKDTSSQLESQTIEMDMFQTIVVAHKERLH